MKQCCLLVALLSSSVVTLTESFVPHHQGGRSSQFVLSFSASAVEGSSSSATKEEEDPLGLPTELRKITDAFAFVGDDQLRHKQLLYMANQMPAIDPSGCTPENKVPGCLSTVFVDGSAEWSDEKEGYVINYVGESDGLLTKGLVALLIR